jgi:hypothetical protein
LTTHDNRIYRGSWQYGVTQAVWQSKKDYARKVVRDQPLRTEQVERLRIVPDDLWVRVQLRLDSEPKPVGRKPWDGDRKSRPRLLNGLFRCPTHDRPLYVGGPHGHMMFCKACKEMTAAKRPLFSHLNRGLALRLTCRALVDLVRADDGLVALIIAACREEAGRAGRPDPAKLDVLRRKVQQAERRYQIMLAARQQVAESLRREYQSVAEIILCIDGLPPEKGHETLYVVRELTRKRVWFAEPLISATEDEARRLIEKAREWAQSLGPPVGLWMSDKQEAFIKGIAAEFPEVPHRYRDNHLLRDLAKPVLEADSHAKAQMRKKVRGPRVIEQAVLARRKAGTKDDLTPETPEATGTATMAGADLSPAVVEPAGPVVLDYRAAVRGILNDDQGGPPHPPGLRMAEALGEVQESIQRDLGAKKGGSRWSNSAGSRDASRRGWTKSRSGKG